MATLQGAIQELIGVINALSGIKYAPDEPNESVTAWPAAFAYATDGVAWNEPPPVAKDLHNIQIAVVMPFNDYRQATRTMLPLYESIRNAIISHRNGRTSSHYNTFGAIRYTLGPVEWAQGELMYGYVFTLEDVKIINTVT